MGYICHLANIVSSIILGSPRLSSFIFIVEEIFILLLAILTQTRLISIMSQTIKVVVVDMVVVVVMVVVVNDVVVV